MSIIDRNEYECPNCKNKLMVQFCDSVNVDKDPRLKELILNGAINSTVCSTCGQRIVINQPFLYHDMSKKFMIYYIPEHVSPDEFLESVELVTLFSNYQNGQTYLSH